MREIIYDFKKNLSVVLGTARQYNVINMFEALVSIPKTKMLITCGIFQMYSYAIPLTFI